MIFFKYRKLSRLVWRWDARRKTPSSPPTATTAGSSLAATMPSGCALWPIFVLLSIHTDLTMFNLPDSRGVDREVGRLHQGQGRLDAHVPLRRQLLRCAAAPPPERSAVCAPCCREPQPLPHRFHRTIPGEGEGWGGDERWGGRDGEAE